MAMPLKPSRHTWVSIDVANLPHAQYRKQHLSSVKSPVDTAKAPNANACLWASTNKASHDHLCTRLALAKHLAALFTCFRLCATLARKSCGAGAWLAARGCSQTSHRVSAW